MITSNRLFPTNHDLTCSGYLAVKLLHIVYDLDVKCFFAAVEFKIGRYSPRVPTCTVSPERHYALGNLFTIVSRDNNFGIERGRVLDSVFLTIRGNVFPFLFSCSIGKTTDHDVQFRID